MQNISGMTRCCVYCPQSRKQKEVSLPLAREGDSLAALKASCIYARPENLMLNSTHSPIRRGAHLREEGGGQLQLQALLLPQVALQLVAELQRRQVLARRQR